MEQNGPLPKDGTKRSPAKRWNKMVPCQKMEQNGPLPKDGTKWSPAKSRKRSPARSEHGLLPDRYMVSCQKLETVSCQIDTWSPAKSWKRSPARSEQNGLLPKVGTKRSPAKSRNKRSPAKSRNKNGLLPKVGTKRSPAKSRKNDLLPEFLDKTVLPTDTFHCHPTQRALFLQRSAHTWLVCGSLLLHFLLNLVLWVLRSQPTTKGAANSLRNLIIWVGASHTKAPTRVEGILNQKSQVKAKTIT